MVVNRLQFHHREYSRIQHNPHDLRHSGWLIDKIHVQQLPHKKCRKCFLTSSIIHINIELSISGFVISLIIHIHRQLPDCGLDWTLFCISNMSIWLNKLSLGFDHWKLWCHFGTQFYHGLSLQARNYKLWDVMTFTNPWNCRWLHGNP